MSRKISSSILKKLRDVMKDTSHVSQSVQAFIIPSHDNHGSEYIGEYDKRQTYISGFTGSYGTAIVTEHNAAFWVDGRYELQASQQLNDNWVIMKQNSVETPTHSKWLSDVLESGSRVGFDPHLMSFGEWKKLSRDLESEKLSLVPVKNNLVDVIWENKPPRNRNKLECLPIALTGKHSHEKISMVREELQKHKCCILVITELDEIAWLFNLRGSDIEYNAVFYAYAIVTLESVFLFIDAEKVTNDAHVHLQNEQVNVTIFPYESTCEFLGKLVKESKGRIWISAQSNCALVSIIPENSRFMKITPIATNKALKNAVEIEGAKQAHIKDAVALCEFFFWLENNFTHNISEIDAAEYLDNLRKEQKDCIGPSFETISAFGTNAAIIHYKPHSDTNKLISQENLYLVDSGGQYRDGTTDVTRTLHFGTPTDFQKKCYTLVLKGVIAVSTAIFPKYIIGNKLDSFARQFLWKEGLDYGHGTGHGVGAYLNVHEGPMGISFRPYPNDPGLQPGMILSIEPGYYEQNNFGIRIENLAFIKKHNSPHNFNELDYLEFEQLTLVPLELKLIESSLLTSNEVKWVNEYHSTCREVIGLALKEQGKSDLYQWLVDATNPIQ